MTSPRHSLLLRTGRFLAWLVLPALAIAILLPPLIPGLKTVQLALSGLPLAAAVTIAARWLRGLRTGRGWRLASGAMAVVLALLALLGWGFASFFLDPDNGIVVSRELAMVVSARGQRYYVYQVSSIPDGWDGAEIMERRGLLRASVWTAGYPPLAAEIFDGRTLRLGRHRLRLGHRDGGLAAWVDGRTAKVWETR